MDETTATGPRGGFTMLDAAALVAGSAVASIHLRSLAQAGATPAEVVAASPVFAALTTVAAGPFLWLIRRGAGVGDRLWAVLGLPWVLSAVILSASPQVNDGRARATLLIGLGLASFLAMATVWQTWVTPSVEDAGEAASGPWTNRFGLALAVAWPIQWGLALVVQG